MLRSRHSKRHEHTGENEPTKRKKKGAYTSQTVLQPPLSQIPLVLILHLFKTDYQLNDIFPVEITMKNIEIIGRTGTIPFLEMKIQNSYTLEQGILKEFISVTENLGTRKDFGHGMVERDGREKTF